MNSKIAQAALSGIPLGGPAWSVRSTPGASRTEYASPDRETLVTDAITDHVAAEVPVPDTGSIDTDLRELARSRVRAILDPAEQSWMTAALATDAARLPEVTRIKRRFAEDRF